MQDKLVSIIIPYYKKKKYIKQTLNSIFSQNYKNKEIFLIYDQNEKKDLEYIKKITSEKKIIIIKNKDNLGVSASRNLALERCKGYYIAFIDSDDVWHKNKLRIQISFMEKNKYEFTHTSYNIINKNNRIIGYRKANSVITHKQLLNSCDVGLSSVIIKKKTIKNMKFPNIKTKEDYIFWLKITKKINLYGIDQPLFKWRKLKKSLSSNFTQKIKDGFLVYNKYMKFNLIKSILFLFILSFNFVKKNINSR